MSDAMVFALTVLCAYRLWRLVAVDILPPFVWVREAAENTIEARFGPTWAAGVTCAWCSGAWASFGVVAGVWALRPLPLPALWFAATSTAVGLIAQRDEA